jgi:hypothetical protein
MKFRDWSCKRQLYNSFSQNCPTFTSATVLNQSRNLMDKRCTVIRNRSNHLSGLTWQYDTLHRRFLFPGRSRFESPCARYESSGSGSVNKEQNRYIANISKRDNSLYTLRSEVFTAVTMKNSVFWDVKPCGPCKTQCFGWTFRLHLTEDNNRQAKNLSSN